MSDGLDCWGLFRLIYAEVRGIDLPSYSGLYASAEERREISGLIAGAKPQWQQVTQAQEFDALTFRRGRHESHIGIVVRPGRMLHITQDKPSCIERYDTGYWANRLTGIWRYSAA